METIEGMLLAMYVWGARKILIKRTNGEFVVHCTSGVSVIRVHKGATLRAAVTELFEAFRDTRGSAE